jgi:hypothetical protein
MTMYSSHYTRPVHPSPACHPLSCIHATQYSPIVHLFLFRPSTSLRAHIPNASLREPEPAPSPAVITKNRRSVKQEQIYYKQHKAKAQARGSIWSDLDSVVSYGKSHFLVKAPNGNSQSQTCKDDLFQSHLMSKW